jgi:hypothetical protein
MCLDKGQLNLRDNRIFVVAHIPNYGAPFGITLQILEACVIDLTNDQPTCHSHPIVFVQIGLITRTCAINTVQIKTPGTEIFDPIWVNLCLT